MTIQLLCVCVCAYDPFAGEVNTDISCACVKIHNTRIMLSYIAATLGGKLKMYTRNANVHFLVDKNPPN